MEHSRHYSPEEANEALPRVVELLDDLRDARARLSDREAREALAEAAPANGGGEAGRTVSQGFLDIRDALRELQERQVVLRDLDRGLVDFPALRDGREVYLCWEEGEEEVGFWHEPDAGHAGRRPLDDG
ncbi:MAG: DUF2203 domain-containing protein [Thermoleophilaceae bacterium]